MRADHWRCPYCEQAVMENQPCCGELHGVPCGDEGQMCADCFEDRAAYWAARTVPPAPKVLCAECEENPPHELHGRFCSEGCRRIWIAEELADMGTDAHE